MPDTTPTRWCAECDAPIPPGSRSDRKFCSKQCSRISARRREETAYQCERCGIDWKSRRRDSRFCRPCAAQFAAESAAVVHSKRAADRRMPVPHPSPSALTHLPPQHPVRSPIKHPPLLGKVFVFGPCEWCGEQFTQLATTFATRSLSCSERCRKRRELHRYRRRRGRFTITQTDRLAIYERDDWICQLCGELVDRDAHYLDDWAPSLDHIIPQSHVLVPDHSDANLRTAHRWCNAVRGDDRYYTAADLAS